MEHANERIHELRRHKPAFEGVENEFLDNRSRNSLAVIARPLLPRGIAGKIMAAGGNIVAAASGTFDQDAPS